MARRPQVALMIETAGAYGWRLLLGVTRYLRMHRSWSVFLERREIDSIEARWLEPLRGTASCRAGAARRWWSGCAGSERPST